MLEALDTITNPPRSVPDLPEKELTEPQLQAALSLAQGNSIVATAGAVGVNERTVDRWKKLPEFQSALKQAREDIYQEALAQVKTYALKAVQTLARLMDSKADYVKLQASTELLRLGLEMHSVSELESKVAELETRLQPGKKDRLPWAI